MGDTRRMVEDGAHTSVPRRLRPAVPPPAATSPGPPPEGRHRRENAPFAARSRRSLPGWRGIAAAEQSIGDWFRRPSGQLLLPGLLLLAMIATSGAAGAFLVPAAADRGAAADSTLTTVPDAGAGDPDQTAIPGPSGAPGGPGSDIDVPAAPSAAGRPAEALTGWARQAATRVDIPMVALQSYGYAELVVANTTPSCRLSWTTLAAIGMVESTHGRVNGSSLDTNGRTDPPIIGLELDGEGGRQLVADTEDGMLDGDTVYDRAVGPMQFIPTTWNEFAVDADGDGITDPQDIDDAALAAANYLCRGGRDLSTAGDWWNAILSYNNVQPYAQTVFNTANEYGVQSRT